MDILIIVIMWIVGLSAGFMLLMAIGFSAGGAAQTGNSELGILSIVSSLLLIYLVWMGVSSLFSSNGVEGMDKSSSVQEVKVKKHPKTVVDYETLSVDVSGIRAPSSDVENKVVKTEKKRVSLDNTTEVKARGENNYELLLWAFYAIVFISYFSWVFSPSTVKGKGKDLVKKKIIGSMTLKKDEAGLHAWHPNWRPEED